MMNAPPSSLVPETAWNSIRYRRKAASLLGLGLAFCVLTPLEADVVLAPLFQEHAVLQCDQPVPVWGRAEPGEKVRVSFAGQSVSTKADDQGRWSLTLQPLKVSRDPSVMIVRGRNTLRVRDILVGEVWLTSGQSNMAWSVGASANPDLEIAGALWPQIRQIKINMEVAESPQDRVDGQWEVCSPCTVAKFTAVGYYFARELHRDLRIPIGIVNCSVGGSSIEAWLSPDALLSVPDFAVVGDRWRRMLERADPAKVLAYELELANWKESVARAARVRDGNVPPARPPALVVGPGHFARPSGLYHGMLSPLLPYALRGILWYQGESNAARADEYRKLFPALIRDWRSAFRRESLPFYWVQAPNYEPKDPTGITWAQLREAQSQALALPATGQAVTIDIGSAHNNHPYNKQDVGIRLALIAKAKTYGRMIDDSGPRYHRIERMGSRLHVEFAYAESGLEARGRLVGFEIAGIDRRYVAAEARIEGNQVVVSSQAVEEPVLVRYAWANNPPASLYEIGGLPAEPFRAGLVPVD